MREIDERMRIFLRRVTTARQGNYRQGGRRKDRLPPPVSLPRLTCLEKSDGDDEKRHPGPRR